MCCACLIKSEDTLNSYVVKEQRETNDTKTTHLLRINYSTNRTKIVKNNTAQCDNVNSAIVSADFPVSAPLAMTGCSGKGCGLFGT